MIVDSPIVTNVFGGTGPLIPQDGDSQLVIPPVANLVLPMILPAIPLPTGSTVPQDTSFWNHSGDVRTNQASGSINVCNFGPGMWDIEIIWTVGWSLLTRTIAITNFLRFSGWPLVNNIALIPMNASLEGTVVLRRKFQILFRQATQLQLGFAATAAGETIVTQVSTIASKML